MGERIRGRLGVKLRKARLAAEPLCRHCRARGLVRLATVPDHVKPLALGGIDASDNIRCLCADCHRAATAKQFGHKLKQVISITGWPVEE